MSLDFYLVSQEPVEKTCEICGCKYKDKIIFFEANITHNLVGMAEKAGIYECLWHTKPGTKASDIVPTLTEGLKQLEERPEYFKQFDSFNGWGTYDDFVPFVIEVLEACKAYPDALVKTST